METDELIMAFDKPHFSVKLYETLLKVDVKEGAMKKLEGFVESNPHLRESLGLLFQMVVPLDVLLKNIDTVRLSDEGKVQIVIPHRRDLHITLEKDEAEKLVDKLNELIPVEKAKEADRIMTSSKVERESAEQRAESSFMAGESERQR
jgi:hypothetical protein